MDPPPYRPRPGDDLVEPLFAALREDPESAAQREGSESAALWEDQEGDGSLEDGGEDALEGTSQARRKNWLGAVLLAGVLLAMASYWESIQIWLSGD